MLIALNNEFSDAQGQLTQYFGMGYGRNSNSSKLLWLYVLATNKTDEDPSKNERTTVLTALLPLEIYGNLSRRSRAANSEDPGPI